MIEDEFEKIENELERLSIEMINIFKKYKEKGVIGAEEYKKHVKYKKEFLRYLNNNKR